MSILRIVILATVAAVVFAACGAQNDGGSETVTSLASRDFDTADSESMVEVEAGFFESTKATSAVAEPAFDELEEMAVEEMEMAVELAMSDDFGDESFGNDGDFAASAGPTGQPVSQQRMIVRTAEVFIKVQDVEASLFGIATLASDLGGWVVSSQEFLRRRGFISIRVPAPQLDSAISSLRSIAVEVEQVTLTSRDVTDEYVDNQARLTNLQATAEALRKLLDQAENVEEALEVQEFLTEVQSEIERLQGRIKLLEETTAFSLVNVNLSQVAGEMILDAGADQTASMGQIARFRATFIPPEGIEEFVYTWDFGDGSRPVTSNRTAPTPDENVRVTATITHVYGDDRDSPYIAEIEINGQGDTGVFEGKDTIMVTVTRLPSVEVFAGEGLVAEEGEDVEFSGSFTRPEGLRNVSYEWDFGDGSAPATGAVPDDRTRVPVVHAYEHHRPQPYMATLTITADSVAGEVESSATLPVFVDESEGWVIAGWSAGEQWKSAVRAMSGIGQGLGTFFIWVGILSPLWIIGGAVLFITRRGRSQARV